MIWLALFGIVAIIITSIRIKTKKLELNDNDLALFNKFKAMMKGKFIARRPDNLTEWEQHLWLLAVQERDNEGNKKVFAGIGYFILAVIVVGLLFLIAGN